MKYLTLLLSLFFSELIFSAPNFSSSRELILPDFQFQQIKSDLPAQSIYLEKDINLWITGKKSIWRWNLTENTLKRIPLLSEKSDNDRLKKVVIHNGLLYVLAQKSIFQISFDPLRAVKLRSKNHMQYSVDLTLGYDGVYWVTNNQIYWVDHDNRKLESLNYPVKVTSKDKIYFLPNAKKMWQIRKNGIILHDYNQGYNSMTLKRTKNRIRNLSISGSDLYISTKYAVLRYNSLGKLQQSIPVENNRKLILMEQNKGKHSYLFSDKLLEVYDLENKKIRRYQLNLGRVRKANGISSGDSIVSLLLDGFPRVFQLSKDR